VNGFLLLDKPGGLTSFAVVRRVSHALGVKKIGHCGTLDPLATGLLILCVGKATKLAQFVTAAGKSYEFQVILGAESSTYDRDGEITEVQQPDDITEKQVHEALEHFRGTIAQRPPLYSALKYKGRPLYKYARADVAVEPTKREVVISRIELLEFSPPRLKLSIDCSKGTYVRSVAHDLGRRLGCGGYVNELRRTAIGEVTVEQATTLEMFERVVESGGAKELLLSMDEMLPLPSVYLNREAADRVGNGVEIKGRDIARCDQPMCEAQVVALRSQQGELLAVGRSLLDEDRRAEWSQQRAIEYIRVL
jgi:tRNA pseudouridine55 synthase